MLDGDASEQAEDANNDDEDLSDQNEDNYAGNLDSDEMKKIMRMLTKTFEISESTGRLNQLLTCLQCKRSFAKLHNGIDHVRTHFKSRPFSCPNCGKSFTQAGNRDRHIQNAICSRRMQRKRQKEADK